MEKGIYEEKCKAPKLVKRHRGRYAGWNKSCIKGDLCTRGKEMKIILTLDDSNGMLFNHRRQSSDIVVKNRIKDFIHGELLYLNAYSAEQFKDTDIPLSVNEDFLHKAGRREYCFVETEKLSDVKEDIEEFVIFRWNRRYPNDFVLDVLREQCGMACVSAEEFAGRSHERITMEIWRTE